MTHTLQSSGITFLQELVRTPGEGGDLAAVAEVTARQMRALGFDEVWTDENGNVVGKRCSGKPGPRLLFDAHLDTVGIGDPGTWDIDPLSGEERDGKIWGRGSTDDKASLAAMVVGIACLPRDRFAGDLFVSGSVGEEILEGAGLESVLDRVQPDGVIIGEPTDGRLGLGHKGRARLVFSLAGKAAHSSSPEVGENAIDKAVEAVRRVRQVPALEDPFLGRSVMEPIQILSSPYPSPSTIPYACQVVFDRRLVRGETRESVLALYRAAMAGVEGWSLHYEELQFTGYTGKSISRLDFHPAWVVEAQSAWVQTALAGLARAGIAPVTYGVPYCTNGSTTAGERGIPTLLFGPSSVLLAHAANEYVAVDAFVQAIEGYQGLAQSLSGWKWK